MIFPAEILSADFIGALNQNAMTKGIKYQPIVAKNTWYEESDRFQMIQIFMTLFWIALAMGDRVVTQKSRNLGKTHKLELSLSLGDVIRNY